MKYTGLIIWLLFVGGGSLFSEVGKTADEEMENLTIRGNPTVEYITRARYIQRTCPGTAAAAALYLRLGQMLEKQKDYAGAIREYETCCKQSPDATLVETAVVRLAYCQVQRNKNNAAIETLKTYMENYSGAARNEEALYVLGWAYYNTGNKTAARESWDRYRAVNPTGPRIRTIKFFLGENKKGRP